MAKEKICYLKIYEKWLQEKSGEEGLFTFHQKEFENQIEIISNWLDSDEGKEFFSKEVERIIEERRADRVN